MSEAKKNIRWSAMRFEYWWINDVERISIHSHLLVAREILLNYFYSWECMANIFRWLISDFFWLLFASLDESQTESQLFLVTLCSRVFNGSLAHIRLIFRSVDGLRSFRAIKSLSANFDDFLGSKYHVERDEQINRTRLLGREQTAKEIKNLFVFSVAPS